MPRCVCHHPCSAFSSTAAQEVQALSSKLAAAESRAAAADAAFASASAASKKIEEAAAVQRSALEKQLQLASGEDDTCCRAAHLFFALTHTHRPTPPQHRASRTRCCCAARQRGRCAARRGRSRNVDETANIRGATPTLAL